MSLNEVVMVSACRTPIGDYGGTLQGVRANDLSKLAVKLSKELVLKPL
jgi:acetyl-CoA C-acetyltransferase